MPEFHAEPYLHLAGVSATSALIAWGAFYFRVRGRGGWKLVDDRDLAHVHPPRSDSIGVRSAPYGPALVNVFDAAGQVAATARTETTNWCHLTGLTSRHRLTPTRSSSTTRSGPKAIATTGGRAPSRDSIQAGNRYIERVSHASRSTIASRWGR